MLDIAVTRMIPKETLLGLLTGALSLHGGVVRDSAGRIVAHLAMPAGAATLPNLVPGLGWVAQAFQSYQLHKIGLSLTRVETQLASLMNVTQAGVLLSGLGLVTTLAGHVFLAGRLRQLETRLGQIEQNTRKTVQLLEAVQHSHLQEALDQLRHAQSPDVAERVRHGCLMAAKQSFGRLVHQYQRLWGDRKEWVEQQAIEGSYTIALLGSALATSELGLGPQAATDFAQGVNAWGQHARAFCLGAVVRDAPEHLLHHRYQAQLPARQLCALLDFAHDTQHRLDWLDMLRAREANAPVLRLPAATLEANMLEFAKMLSARHEVLQAYAAHFQFLAEHRLSASAFEAQVGALPVAEPDQPHFITWGVQTGEPSVLLS